MNNEPLDKSAIEAIPKRGKRIYLIWTLAILIICCTGAVIESGGHLAYSNSLFRVIVLCLEYFLICLFFSLIIWGVTLVYRFSGTLKRYLQITTIVTISFVVYRTITDVPDKPTNNRVIIMNYTELPDPPPIDSINPLIKPGSK